MLPAPETVPAHGIEQDVVDLPDEREGIQPAVDG
jgi:hypothetical protein